MHTTPVRHANTGGDTYDFTSFFEAIRPYIDGDLSICNMETPVDAYGGNKNLSGYPIFNAPYEILEALKFAGFDHLVTANNHSFDKKLYGLQNTLENISRAGLTSTGTYTSEEEFNTPTILDVNGLQVGIIAYTYSLNGLDTWVPSDLRPFAIRKFNDGSLTDIPRMTEDIENLRQAGAELVVVSLHWGAEYGDKPSAMQERIARALCEAGADIIYGTHSHSPHPMEWYTRGEDGRRSLIMYSLGNFAADQIAANRLKTQYGMLVDVTVTKSPDGSVTLDDCSVLPTLFYRERGYIPQGGYNYSLIPLVSAELHGETRPGFMPDDAAWTWGRDAYAHVLKVAGGDFVR
jgi:poly-gamma-glutamate synthesis protein (capsule biosynthesis protein)